MSLRNKQNESLQSQKYNFHFYLTEIGNHAASFLIDLELINIAPISNKSNLLTITLKMKSSLENGLSSTNEFESLTSIEDIIVDDLIDKHEAVYAGSCTTKGNRYFYFYLKDNEIYENSLKDIINKISDYSFTYEIKKEEDWETYFKYLYPSSFEIPSINNRMIIDILKKEGDTLIKKREVNHWIYFKTKNDKNEFMLQILKDKFRVVVDEYNKSILNTPYKLKIVRDEIINISSMDTITNKLMDLANEFNAEYDGWETSVERG